ncbi:uncharacterized protein LOC111369103 [Olea europaea var. sylvestris]|uniref:uncharacterized protein LOC111369103 n=1 Tax=Olea europaea var. sylvestris TaxID=158386 RepID=UPI000C1D0FC9|nr:uncharacterized protein LOC111369103 [Olea europaea var. sylvestris]
MPYLKCIRPIEAKEIMFEVYVKTCGSHQEAISLAFKILQQGYYWPTMREDAKELVRKCDTCQHYGNLIHVPAEQQAAIFGVVLVTDNGRQFDNHSFKTFCASYYIDHRLTLVAHPQSNGKAKVTNRVILWDLKTRLEKEKGLWADEPSNVL